MSWDAPYPSTIDPCKGSPRWCHGTLFTLQKQPLYHAPAVTLFFLVTFFTAVLCPLVRTRQPAVRLPRQIVALPTLWCQLFTCSNSFKQVGLGPSFASPAFSLNSWCSLWLMCGRRSHSALVTSQRVSRSWVHLGVPSMPKHFYLGSTGLFLLGGYVSFFHLAFFIWSRYARSQHASTG